VHGHLPPIYNNFITLIIGECFRFLVTLDPTSLWFMWHQLTRLKHEVAQIIVGIPDSRDLTIAMVVIFKMAISFAIAAHSATEIPGVFVSMQKCITGNTTDVLDLPPS
jgi:hypothetical protein